MTPTPPDRLPPPENNQGVIGRRLARWAISSAIAWWPATFFLIIANFAASGQPVGPHTSRAPVLFFAVVGLPAIALGLAIASVVLLTRARFRTGIGWWAIVLSLLAVLADSWLLVVEVVDL